MTLHDDLVSDRLRCFVQWHGGVAIARGILCMHIIVAAAKHNIDMCVIAILNDPTHVVVCRSY